VDTNTEPDLLVLGFQELDLSTEALIYSTSTFKEDAWCTAIFAALGERAELYEKVHQQTDSALDVA
jgi:phosphatidylinositol-bisphosphatase